MDERNSVKTVVNTSPIKAVSNSVRNANGYTKTDDNNSDRKLGAADVIINHSEQRLSLNNDQGSNQSEANEQDFKLVERNKKTNKRSIVVLGDSTIKSILPHKMQIDMAATDKIYMK